MCINVDDVSSTTAMLKHLKQKHPVQMVSWIRWRGDNAVGWCSGVGVAPWSMRVMRWEPQLISLPKTRLLSRYATIMLVLLVTDCPHRGIKNNSK